MSHATQQANDGRGELPATATSELDEITEDCKVTKAKDGTTTRYKVLELAKRNAHHFNKKDSSHSDDEMGSHGARHRLAMEAAAVGDKNKARAMEASAQHFLSGAPSLREAGKTGLVLPCGAATSSTSTR